MRQFIASEISKAKDAEYDRGYDEAMDYIRIIEEKAKMDELMKASREEALKEAINEMARKLPGDFQIRMMDVIEILESLRNPHP